MIASTLTYATPSVLESTRESAILGLAADVARPVAFHAKVVEHVLGLRLTLQTLGQLIWHRDDWRSDETFADVLDPVVTVHPDRVFFEAFSADQSAYGLVIADHSLFAPIGAVRHGTTNVDFTAWLWAALGEMRSSRDTTLRIGAEGFEVATASAGGRFEHRVEVPDAWVRGFLQLQGGMALPGTRVSMRPVDLLAAIRFLRHTKAKLSPRALRYEFPPGEDARLVLEPWEHVVPLRGASHTYAEPRTVRTWGRRRLALVEPLLPFAERVDVYLKGRGLPSFYAVKLPGLTFVLGLSGWTAQRWTDVASFDLLVAPARNVSAKPRVLAHLRACVSASAADVATAVGLDVAVTTQLLAALCAEGRCLFDVESRTFRHRELFATPIDLAALYPPDVRREAAAAHVAAARVTIGSAAARETRKQRRLQTPDGPVFREVLHRDWVVLGQVDNEPEVEVVLSDEDRVIFGRCGCAFFREHILGKGPCEHMLALLVVAQPQRREAASSVAIPREAVDGGAEAVDDA